MFLFITEISVVYPRCFIISTILSSYIFSLDLLVIIFILYPAEKAHRLNLTSSKYTIVPRQLDLWLWVRIFMAILFDFLAALAHSLIQIWFLDLYFTYAELLLLLVAWLRLRHFGNVRWVGLLCRLICNEILIVLKAVAFDIELATSVENGGFTLSRDKSLGRVTILFQIDLILLFLRFSSLQLPCLHIASVYSKLSHLPKVG